MGVCVGGQNSPPMVTHSQGQNVESIMLVLVESLRLADSSLYSSLPFHTSKDLLWH